MDLEAARTLLRHERAELLAMGRDLATSFEDIVAAAKDSNLDDEHDPEGSTIAVDRSLVSSLGRSTADRIAQIDAALARIDAGTYGTCLACGRPISPGRLEARPAATLCITCAGGQYPHKANDEPAVLNPGVAFDSCPEGRSRQPGVGT